MTQWMNDYELDLSDRLVSHSLWQWVPGMLGVNRVGGKLSLQERRYTGQLPWNKYVPSLKDCMTVHLIWESIKKFNLDGYHLVRAYENSYYKSGFYKPGGKIVLIFNSKSEGRIAGKTWLWFASKCI